MTELEVEERRSPDALPWERLEAEENVFLEPAYVRSWLRHLATGELAVAVSSEPGGAQRVFPVVRSTDRVLGMGVEVWKSLGWNSAWYPYSFLPAESESVEPFFRHLDQSRDRWNGVLVTCPSPLQPEVERAASSRGWSASLWSRKVLPYVTVRGGWEAYWNGREKWLRVNVGRFERRAEKQGDVAFRKASSREECDRLLERFVALHDARWSARGQRSKFVTRERHRRFLEDVAREAFDSGKLDFPYLELDGEAIAMAICFRSGGKLYYVWPTFDVRRGRLAPGKLLLYRIIKDAFDSGLSEVDLGPGSDEYKFYWTDDKREVSQIFVYRESLLLWGSYHVLPRIRTSVRERLEKTLGENVARRLAGALERVRVL